MISTVANTFPVCDYDTHVGDKDQYAAIQFYKSESTIYSDVNERYRHAELTMEFERNVGYEHAFIVRVKAQMSSTSDGTTRWYGLKVGAESKNTTGLSMTNIIKASKVMKKIHTIVEGYMDSIDYDESKLKVADVFELILKGLKFTGALVPNCEEIQTKSQWRGAYWTQFYAIEDLRVVKAFCQAFEIACRECMA
jgi:hypothetical protein